MARSTYKKSKISRFGPRKTIFEQFWPAKNLTVKQRKRTFRFSKRVFLGAFSKVHSWRAKWTLLCRSPQSYGIVAPPINPPIKPPMAYGIVLKGVM